jgi:hypothetical protein
MCFMQTLELISHYNHRSLSPLWSLQWVSNFSNRLDTAQATGHNGLYLAYLVTIARLVISTYLQPYPNACAVVAQSVSFPLELLLGMSNA